MVCKVIKVVFKTVCVYVSMYVCIYRYINVYIVHFFSGEKAYFIKFSKLSKAKMVKSHCLRIGSC